MSWPLVKLEDIFDIARGGSPRPIDAYITDESDGLNWISIKDASNSDKYIEKTKLKIKKEGLSKSRFVKPGDFLLTNSMSFGRPYIMKTSGCIHDGWLVLSGDLERIFPDYFYYLLGSETLHRKFASLAAGAVVKNLNINLVKGVEIPLPPLDEQKRIAAILDKADAIRRKRQQAINLADDFLRSVFLDMFGDPVTNPKGWEVKKLGGLTTIRRGASPRPIANFIGGNVPWIKIGDGSKGDQVYLNSTKVHVTQEGADKSVFLEKGSLIFANCGVSLGFARILNISGCIHDGWLSIENIDKDLNKIFILKWINQLTLYFRRIAPDGTQPNLNSGIMKDQEIILPPIELQNKFEDILFKHEDVLTKLNDGLLSANESFNSISQKAFAGEL